MFDKTIFINDKFNIFLNNQNNTHYLQINYIEKNNFKFDTIQNLILNNSDLLCRNSIDKDYINSTLKKAIGIVYVKKYPYNHDYSLRSRSEDPDSDQIVAFCILSLVDFHDNVGFPFDENYTPVVTNFLPKKVGEILLLCAIDDPIKVSIETESGEREDDFITFGIGTYIQYQACRIFRDVYNLDYSLGHSASLSLLIHYMKIGYIFGIPYIKNFGEINMDDVVDHLYLDFIYDNKNLLLSSNNPYDHALVKNEKKFKQFYQQKFKEAANAKKGTFEEQIRLKLATNLLDNVYDKLTNIFTSDLNKLSVLIDEPDLNTVKTRLEDEPEFFEHLFYEISTKFVEPHKDLYLRFMPLRNTYQIQKSNLQSSTQSDRLNILRNYSFKKIKNYLTVLSSIM